MKEIKEILEELTLTNSTSAIADVREGYSFEHRVGIPEALNKLKAYINSHYIAKDKVKGLKMEEIEWSKLSPLASEMVRFHDYNIAVSKINKAVDDLVEDNNE